MSASFPPSALLTTVRQFPAVSRVSRKARWLIFAAVCVTTLGFAGFTQHAWEDYFIAYRICTNFATGHGPVYTAGEKVQAFSSPLNLLILTALKAVTGSRSDELVLWLFRVMGAVLLGTVAVLLYEIARRTSLSRLPTALLIGVFVMDSKVLDFTINGQESALMVFFFAWALHALTVRSKWTTLELGLAGAGLMWTRPDGFIYITALTVGFMLFSTRLDGYSRLGFFQTLLVAAGITTILYLPWLVWSWYYFGSPVPHTILAKGLARDLLKGGSSMNPLPLLGYCLSFPFGMLAGRTAAGGTFLPPNTLIFGGWHWTAVLFAKGLACLCGLYWCVPFGRPQGRAVSFAFMLSLIYVSRIAAHAAAWYFPTCTLMGAFVCAQVVQDGVDWGRSRGDLGDRRARFWAGFVCTVGVGVLVATLVLTLCAAYQLRIAQRVIESGARKQIGLWLRQQAASPAESVFLEPLGYIGYFSQLKMLDVPGLCAPEVVAAERRLKSTSLAKLIPELRPDWLVLRANEADQIRTQAPRLLADVYSPVKVFDVSRQLAAYRWLPGRAYLRYDEKYIVFKRNRPSTNPQVP